MLRRGWRRALVAVVLALAVPGAPIASTVSARCNRCAPTCPMHRRGKPTCHKTPAAHGGHHDCGMETAPGLVTPSCGHPHAVPAMSVAPAVLPSAGRVTALHVTAPAPRAATDVIGRGTEPPDTPPPIAFS